MKIKILITAFFIIILISACGTNTPPPPTTDVNAIYTSVGQTVVAELTQTAAANSPTPETTFTATQNLSTESTAPTSAVEVETIIPTSAAETPNPLASPTILAEASPTDQYCDNAAFVSDISVQDGTEMVPGQSFEKTWLIKNIGTCTWTEGYHAIYGYGEEMNGQARPLPSIVAPNETVEVTVVFTAPIETGEYSCYWRMANTKGASLGGFFSVKIVVR